MDPAKTRLEAWHEILNGATPSVSAVEIARPSGLVDSDVDLRFGDMVVTRGNAFTLGPNNIADETVPLDEAIPVAKEVVQIEQATYLIEKIPYLEAKPFTDRLPAPAQAMKVNKERVQRAFAAAPKDKKGKRYRPIALAERPVRTSEGERKLAAMTPARLNGLDGLHEKKAGFLIDFSALVTATNFTFGPTTYYVSGDVTLSGLTTI